MSRANLWTSLIATFKASPAKAGVLGLLAVVLMVMVGRQLWPGTPRSAQGAALFDFPPLDDAPIPEAVGHQPRPALPELPDQPARDIFGSNWLIFDRAAEEDVETQPDDAPAQMQRATVLTLDLTLTAPRENGQPYAIINGTTVRVGNEVDGYVVESIGPGYVVLSANGQERVVLHMN